MKAIIVFVLLTALLVSMGCNTQQSQEPNDKKMEVVYPIKTEAPSKKEEQIEAKKEQKVQETVQNIDKKREENKVVSAKEPAVGAKAKNTEGSSEAPIVENIAPPKKEENWPKESPKEASVSKEGKQKEAGPAKKFFYLRIISLPHHVYYQGRAEGIVKHLKNKGIENAEARVSQDPKGNKYWVVDVGKFDDPSVPQAKELKDKVSEMKYEGAQSFKDSWFIER